MGREEYSLKRGEPHIIFQQNTLPPIFLPQMRKRCIAFIDYLIHIAQDLGEQYHSFSIRAPTPRSSCDCTIKALVHYKIHGSRVGRDNIKLPIRIKGYGVVCFKVDPFFAYITGGSVTAGLGIYDTMQYVLPPIATWCVGQACSMGSLLLTAGAEGMRHSLPNSRVMIHQPSGQAAVSDKC